jgi:hypothetical protein
MSHLLIVNVPLAKKFYLVISSPRRKTENRLERLVPANNAVATKQPNDANSLPKPTFD